MTSFEPIDPMFESAPKPIALLPPPRESFFTRAVKRLSAGRVESQSAVALTLIITASMVILLSVVTLVLSATNHVDNQGIEQHGGRRR